MEEREHISAPKAYLERIRRQELAALEFIYTQTEATLAAEQIQNEDQINSTYRFIAGEVRETIKKIKDSTSADLPNNPLLCTLIKESARPEKFPLEKDTGSD